MPDFLIATFYHFARLGDVETLRDSLQRQCEASGVTGTIVLAAEGLNGTIAGHAGDVRAVLDGLRADPRLAGLRQQEATTGAAQPFRRLKIRLEREIVTFGVPVLDMRASGDHVDPGAWNALITQPDVVVVDVRNRYEVALGSFDRAIDPHTRVFSDLPAWIEGQRSPGGVLHGHPRVAMFCTGGIRCEKSSAYLRAQGLEHVFQLKGGILGYLGTVRESLSLWRGECFVFDGRISVGHGLAPGTATLCRGCGQPAGSWERALLAPRDATRCAGCAARTSGNRRQPCPVTA